MPRRASSDASARAPASLVLRGHTHKDAPRRDKHVAAIQRGRLIDERQRPQAFEACNNAPDFGPAVIRRQVSR